MNARNRVAIVDDDPSVIQNLKNALSIECRKRKLGGHIEVKTFLNAEEMNSGDIYDIYIIDFDMPSFMNGKLAAEMIEKRHNDAKVSPPIIFIHTANSDKFNFKEIKVKYITLVEKSDHFSKSKMIQYVTQFQKNG